jgi:hypothetical protein
MKRIKSRLIQAEGCGRPSTAKSKCVSLMRVFVHIRDGICTFIHLPALLFEHVIFALRKMVIMRGEIGYVNLIFDCAPPSALNQYARGEKCNKNHFAYGVSAARVCDTGLGVIGVLWSFWFYIMNLWCVRRSSQSLLCTLRICGHQLLFLCTRAMK